MLKKIYLRRNPKVAEAIEKAESDLDIDDFKQFEEKMYGDIWDKEKYLSWMYENLLAIRSVMSDNASIYVHLDWHIGHYVKILMDEIFGEDSFRNEIIWTFGGKGLVNVVNNYVRNYNPIYFYTMNDSPTIHLKDGKVSDSVMKRFGKYINENNQILFGTLRASSDKLELEKATKAFISKFGREPQDDDVARDFSEGSYIKDVWDDIPIVRQNEAYAEFVNYSTQKPEKLLERIIQVSSDEGMIVADFFGGSGVTAAVCNKLGRHFIHCDVGINSIQTTRDRLIVNKANFDIYEIRDGISLYRNPIQTMDKIKKLIPGLKNEDSLDKFWEGAIQDPKYGLVPVYVPNLMDSSTRVLDEVLMRRIIHEAIPDLQDLPNVKRIIIYYIDVDDIEKIDEMVKKDKDLDIEIEFRDLKDILDDVSPQDEVQYTLKEDHSRLVDSNLIEITRFYSDAVVRRIKSFNLKSIQNDKKGKFKPIEISDTGLEMIEFISLDTTSNNGVWHSDSEIKIEYTSKLTINGKKTNDYWDGKIYCEKKPLRMKIRNICGDETIFVL